MNHRKITATASLVGIRGVIFDLDGTLVESGLDFAAIRREMDIGAAPILETLAGLREDRRQACVAILARHEWQGADRATPIAGSRQWLDFLDQQGIARGILSRNSRAIIDHTLQRCALPFEDTVGREDAIPKPDGAGIVLLCQRWGLAPREILMVGDFRYDLEAGRHAGAVTALVTRGKAWDFLHLADHVWPDLEHGLGHTRAVLASRTP